MTLVTAKGIANTPDKIDTRTIVEKKQNQEAKHKPECRRYISARCTHQGCGKSPSRAMDVQRLEAHDTTLAKFDPESGLGVLALVETRTGREVAPGRVGVLLQN